MRRCAWFLWLFAACGRIGFDPLDDGGAISMFEPLELPAGGDAFRVVISPTDSNVLYLNAAFRMFRSADRGATWTECTRGPTFGMTAVNGILYAGGLAGLEQSTDGCATWTTIAAADWEVETIAMVVGDIWVGGAGPYKLVGSALVPVATPLGTSWVQSFASSGQVVYVATEDGVVRSDDGGGSWTVVTNGLASLNVREIIIPDPATPLEVLAQTENGVYYTADGGATWSAATNGGEGRTTVASDPTDPLFVLSTTWRGLLRSVTGGVTFQPADVRSAAMAASYVRGLAFDQSGRVYAATGRGVFASDDGATTWSALDQGIDAWTIEDLWRAPGSTTVFAATPTGILRSTDDGETWALYTAGMQAWTSAVVSVHGDSADDPWTGGSFLYSSTAGGTQFVEQTPALTALDQWEVRAVRQGPGTTWFATGHRVWTSTPTWTPHDVDALMTPHLFDLELDAAGDAWVAAETGVYVSRDGGQSFEKMPLVADVNAWTLMLTTDGPVVGTEDGVQAQVGGGWVRAGLEGKNVVDLLYAKGRWFAATLFDGVYTSDDAGVTWSELPGLADRLAGRIALDSTGRLIVGTIGYGLFRTPSPVTP